MGPPGGGTAGSPGNCGPEDRKTISCRDLQPANRGDAPSRGNRPVPAWVRRVCPGRVSTPPGWKFYIPHTNAVARCPGASAFRNCRKRKPLFSRELSVYVLACSLPSVVLGGLRRRLQLSRLVRIESVPIQSRTRTAEVFPLASRFRSISRNFQPTPLKRKRRVMPS